MRETALDLSLPMIDALARAMTARDGDTHQHSQRVQRYAGALAREAGITDYPTLEAIDVAALLHDVGKLGIPDRVLHKPGPLTAGEYDQGKQHVIIGSHLLSAGLFPRPPPPLLGGHHQELGG